MNSNLNLKTYSKNSIQLFITSTFLLVSFLFFIDEGYYNFKWMLQFGNWIAFLIYFVPILSFQALVYFLLKSLKTEKLKIGLSIFLGSVIGLIFVIKVIF